MSKKGKNKKKKKLVWGVSLTFLGIVMLVTASVLVKNNQDVIVTIGFPWFYYEFNIKELIRGHEKGDILANIEDFNQEEIQRSTEEPPCNLAEEDTEMNTEEQVQVRCLSR